MTQPTLELVNSGNGNYGLMFTSENFYWDIEPDMPFELVAVEESCHVGDYLIFKAPYPIIELIDWCNERGIHVTIRSAVYNPKYCKG